MLKTSLKFAAAIATAASLLAGAASAATVYETFDLRYSHPGSYGNQTSHSFSSGDLDLTVTAYQHNQGVLGQQIKVGRWGTGLGSQFSGDSDHKVDGNGPDEIVLFDFGRKVTIERVWFSYFDHYDDFELGSYSGSTLNSYLSDLNISAAWCSGSCNGYSNDFGRSTLNSAQKLMGSILGIGSDHESDQFKIKKIKVSYDDVAPVPLPASGLLLMGALGGIGLMRRRKDKRD